VLILSTFLIYETSLKSILIFIKSFIEKIIHSKENKFFLIFWFLLNVLPLSTIAEKNIVNSPDLDELRICLKKNNFEKCKKLILITEKLQIEASNKGNFKCQSTLLGIQSELIKNLYFEKYGIASNSIIISNLIKNC
tara:strand:+ start:152 stop:562 length:411 start_codon:yes stop_codon:yes gene_type:complete